jgi:hypothetical protein
MLKRFFKEQSGQVVTTELIIVIAIMAIVGVAIFLTLTPSIETGFDRAEESIRALKGGGL